MRRPRRAVLVAAPFALFLAACGSQDATQGSVRDDVRDALLEREGNELSEAEAVDVGDCVSRAMFESGEFSKEDRNDATRAVDGDAPDPELVARVQALVEGCLDDPDPDETDAETTSTTEG